jgi:uncharacterized protein DUF4339
VEPEENWYYLHRAHQVGPYSLPELYMLLAKGVIAPTTLVWSPGRGGWREFQQVTGQPQATPPKRRRAWAAGMLGIAMFLAGLTALERAPTESETGYLLVTASIPKSRPEPLDRIRVYRPKPVYLAAVDKPIAARFAPAGRVLLPDERVELELWQATAAADEPDPYAYYLSQYPSGAFSSLATAKIKQFRKPVVAKKTQRKPAKKESAGTPTPVAPKTTALKAAVKPAGRCTERNRGQCRDRCTAGDTMACQKMQRMGG